MSVKKFTYISAIVALLSTLPMYATQLAFAAGVDSTMYATGATAIQPIVASSSINVSVGANGQGSAQSGSSSSSSSASMQSSGSGSGSVSATDNSSSDTSAVGANLSLEGSGIMVGRADVDNSTEATPMVVFTSVSDNTSLNDYMKSEVSVDSNLKAVAANNDQVQVSYKVPAKLFGFIPMKTTATFTSDNSGNVTVSYPWYRFLESVDDANAKAAVSARAKVAAQGTAASGSAVSVKAKLIDAIVKALESASATSTASASASSNTSASSTSGY